VKINADCANIRNIIVHYSGILLCIIEDSRISFAELPAVGSRIQGFKDSRISFAELPAVGSRIQGLASLSSLRSVQGFKDSTI
jgi:hypothetical protein